MKLRISGNSLRLRLSRSEVARFEEAGHIEDAVEFGSASKLKYSIKAVEDSRLQATYNDSAIEIEVPRHQVQDWSNTDRVAISAEQPLYDENILHILIEKDFQCVHKDSAANADAYPNPLAAQ